MARGISIGNRQRSAGVDAVGADRGPVELWHLGRAHAPVGEQEGDERALARRLLRAALARHVGPERAGQPFEIGPHGKPRLVALAGEPAPAFSMAHAAGVALVAIAYGATVGVDIEPYRTLQMRAERRRLLEAVGAALAPEFPLPGEPQARFFAAWTRLEATAKATGEGVARLLDEVGGRHLGAVEEAEIVRRAAALLAREGVAVHDLAVGSGFAAAVALPMGLAPSPIGDGRALLAWSARAGPAAE
jgi:phosphopantetheinyl transferase